MNLLRTGFNSECCSFSKAHDNGIGQQHYERAGIASMWKRWIRAFKLYAVGQGITDNKQAMTLLHTAGMDVLDIFYKTLA